MDRLDAPISPKIAWRRALIALGLIGGACALVGLITGRAVNSFFVAFPIGFAMLQIGVLRLIRKRNFIDAHQLAQIGADGAPSERTLAGMIAALPDGVGVTHRPMTELHIRFEEIQGITMERSMEHLYITGFTPDFVPRRAGPWNCATLVISTSRADYPHVPIPFASKRAALQWFKYIEARGDHMIRVPTIRVNWRNSLLTVQWIVVTGLFLLPIAGLTRGVEGFSKSLPGILIYVFLCIEAITGIILPWLSSSSEVVTSVIMNLVPGETPNSIDRDHLLLPTDDSVDRIAIKDIRSVDVVLRKPSWSSRPLFQEAKLTEANLTVKIDRNHDAIRTLQLEITRAKEIIREISQSNPDVEITGTDLREMQLDNVYAPNHTRSEA